MDSRHAEARLPADPPDTLSFESPSAAEAEVVADAQAGSEVALETLYRQHHGAIYRYVLFRLGDPMAAEDVVAQVFVAMVRGLRKYRQGDRPFLAWLYGIARNQVALYYRDSGRREDAMEEVIDPYREVVPPLEAGIERREERERLQKALNVLPETQREVVLLRSLLDLSIAETAQLLGRSEGSVKQLHRRGLGSLRTRLGAYLQDRP